MADASFYSDEYLQEILRSAFSDADLFRLPKGILRYDYAHSHGWLVRVRREGVEFSELIYDAEFSSFEDGLRKAIEYRHTLLAAFPKTLERPMPRQLSADPHNRIRRKEEKGKRRPCIYWQAKWHDSEGQLQSENFSTLKFGEDGAKQLALSAATTRHHHQHWVYRVPDPYEKEEWREVTRHEVAKKAALSLPGYGSSKSHLDLAAAESDPFGFEGDRLMAEHLRIERDRKLRDAKVVQFFRLHGSVFCEVCKFNFRSAYPFLVRDIIEVHHIVPISSLSETTRVDFSDLVLLCSNCHLAVHQGDAEENLILAMLHFKA